MRRHFLAKHTSDAACAEHLLVYEFVRLVALLLQAFLFVPVLIDLVLEILKQSGTCGHSKSTRDPLVWLILAQNVYFTVLTVPISIRFDSSLESVVAILLSSLR